MKLKIFDKVKVKDDMFLRDIPTGSVGKVVGSRHFINEEMDVDEIIYDVEFSICTPRIIRRRVLRSEIELVGKQDS